MEEIPNQNAADGDLMPDEAPVLVGKKKKQDDEIDITPMIDMVFLLLIFFVLTSKLNPQKINDLPKARNGEGLASKQWIVINMERGTGQNAVVSRDDKQATKFSEDKEQQEAEIAEYVREGIEKKGLKMVVIRAEGSVRSGEVARVRQAVSEGLDEGQQIYIAVQEQ